MEKIQHSEIKPFKHGKKWYCNFVIWAEDTPNLKMDCRVWGNTEQEAIEKSNKFLTTKPTNDECRRDIH